MNYSGANWLQRGVEAIGVDIKEVSFSARQLEYLKKPIMIDSSKTLDLYLGVLGVLAEHLGEPEIGLLLSEHMSDRDYGMYGYICRNVSSLGEYLQLIARYHAAMGHYCISRFHCKESRCYSEYEVLLHSDISFKHDVTMTLGRRVQFLKSNLHYLWRPVKVGFVFSEPDNLDRYKGAFGENVCFDQPTNFIEVEDHCLDVVINDADSDLLKIFMAQAESIMGRRGNGDDIVQKTKLQLMNRIGTDSVSQEEIASSFNLSRATYQRRLDAKGTSFRKLKHEVIYQLSTKALSETEARITEIALKMGYSDLSAFDRAFSRLSGGVSPIDYRKRFNLSDAG